MHKNLDERHNAKIHPGDISKVIHKISSGKALILSYTLSYALDAIAYKRLNVYISKEIRGQIIWRGLDADVIKYAALTYWGRIISNYYLEKWMNCWKAKEKSMPISSQA